jgi:hypothetical protein
MCCANREHPFSNSFDHDGDTFHAANFPTEEDVLSGFFTNGTAGAFVA